MTLQGFTNEEYLKRYLYTSNLHGGFSSGSPDKYLLRLVHDGLFQFAKSAPGDFLKLIAEVNDDELVVRRSTFFFLLAKALHDKDLPNNLKLDIKNLVFKLIKNDQDFFDFIKYHTTLNGGNQKISTSLRKMIKRFYQEKEPMAFAETVAKQESYHGWSHKDLIKLCHVKCDKIQSEAVLKYVLFGIEQLPAPTDDTSEMITFLQKSHELRTTENTERAYVLIKELHASVDEVNSKLNKNEQVWLAAIPEMTTREVLQCLYRFYKFGFLKPGSQFHAKIIEALTDPLKIKSCNLHPVEVFIYLKFFEKGGKTIDPKLLEYLQKKDIREETLKRLTTPSEPKCKGILQNINRCLKMSYNNIQPTGKKYMVTIDVTQGDNTCLNNKRITCLEAAVAIVRFLSKVEKHVSVAVFKDSQVNFVDISKSHSAIDKLQEHKAAYILPTAPIDWARNKKKPIDVFINFMSCDWHEKVPQEVKGKMEKASEALNKYSKKMKTPEARLVTVFLDGCIGTDHGKNILSIVGLSVDVPKVLEAFCRGRFC